MRYIKQIFTSIEQVALSLVTWLVCRFSRQPSLDAYKDYLLAPIDEKSVGLRVTFLGVSTLLFDDGETAILTDGFFSRPSKLRTLFTKLEPDRKLIAHHLERAEIEHLKAVVVLHSHIDHALDAPEVARQTSAKLIGSESTRNIGLGYGLPEEDIRIIQDGEVLPFGRFRIKLLSSGHSPLTLLSRFHLHHVMLKGKIENPLKPPARWYEYKEGGSYSMFLEHDGKTVLVQGSAGFEKGALIGHHADVVFLSIATLGKLEQSYQEDYWREVVEAVKPGRIIPIHWDDFSLPLDKPLVPMPRPVDDFDKSMEFLLKQERETKIDIKIIPSWIKVDPFTGLTLTPSKRTTGLKVK
jgi:L-ascorbate metabolism protein UlaG (beta-lactamase superfamily)